MALSHSLCIINYYSYGCLYFERIQIDFWIIDWLFSFNGNVLLKKWFARKNVLSSWFRDPIAHLTYKTPRCFQITKFSSFVKLRSEKQNWQSSGPGWFTCRNPFPRLHVQSCITHIQCSLHTHQIRSMGMAVYFGGNDKWSRISELRKNENILVQLNYDREHLNIMFLSSMSFLLNLSILWLSAQQTLRISFYFDYLNIHYKYLN